jgi:hypothetical protein
MTRLEIASDVWRSTIEQAKEEKAPLQLIRDMEERRRKGIEQYGTPVVVGAFDHLRYAYEEALDLLVYLKAATLDPGVRASRWRLRLAYRSAFVVTIFLCQAIAARDDRRNRRRVPSD